MYKLLDTGEQADSAIRASSTCGYSEAKVQYSVQVKNIEQCFVSYANYLFYCWQQFNYSLFAIYEILCIYQVC